MPSYRAELLLNYGLLSKEQGNTLFCVHNHDVQTILERAGDSCAYKNDDNFMNKRENSLAELRLPHFFKQTHFALSIDFAANRNGSCILPTHPPPFPLFLPQFASRYHQWTVITGIIYSFLTNEHKPIQFKRLIGKSSEYYTLKGESCEMKVTGEIAE